MSKGHTIEMGSRWRLRTGGLPWRVTQIDMEDSRVGLSGPGPARSLQYVSFKDLVQKWVKITKDPTPASPAA